MAEDWTIVLSGPLTTKGSLLGALERTGADFSEGQPSIHPSHGLPHDDPSQGWVTLRAQDVDKIHETASLASWSLRMHWHTPDCRVCRGIQSPPCLHCAGKGKTSKLPPPPGEALQAELDALKARLAALEGKG